MEIWKDIKSLEGRYQISNKGNIKSLSRLVPCKVGFRTIKEKLLSPAFSVKGYLNVRVKDKNGELVAVFIHHEVAKQFIGERPKNLVIDHIDGNPKNNDISNLRYVTHAVNLQKRKDAKLDESKVREIRELLKTKKQQEIADMFGVRQSSISRIKRQTRWKSVS